MVHALRELCRTVPSNGTVIDLRPLAASWPIEIVSVRERKMAGSVSNLPAGLADDAAANEAFAQAESEGWLVREQEQHFPLYYYWDSPSEMKEYVDEEWADFIGVEDNVWTAIRSIWSVGNADARIRVRVRMLITRWKLAISPTP
jgi:hypothetical protein